MIRGPSRRLDGVQNAWRSKGLGADGAWLRLDLPEAMPVSQVQLVFDSNFDIEKKMTMSSRRQKQQKPGRRSSTRNSTFFKEQWRSVQSTTRASFQK